MERKFVIADIDGVLRQEKNDSIPPSLIKAIKSVVKEKVGFIALSAAPGKQIKNLIDIPSVTVFAEMGGVEVKRKRKKSFLKISQKGHRQIEFLKEKLGIIIKDGKSEVCGIESIIEGPRFTSLTILTGNPPHYKYSVPDRQAELYSLIEKTIDKHRLKLFLIQGKSETYNWIDVVSKTKKETVKELIRNFEKCKVYYIGDGNSDFEVMQLSNIIPVGLKNSTIEIKKISKEKGIYIDKEGPQGTIEFLLTHILN